MIDLPGLRATQRRRPISWLTAAAVVTGSVTCAALSTSPAAHAAPPEDCAVPYPVADIEDGDAVTGLTVSQGTTPDPFTGEVLGVLEDGIAPGLDMVIAELDSPAIDAAGGIWQGMSGSPVYAENGDLIGAVAYGLSWGSSPIAGITPFEEMDDYFGTSGNRPTRRVAVDRATARKIAAGSDVSRENAQQGFKSLGVVTGVSGVGAGRLDKLSHSFRSYFPKSSYAAGRASGGTTSADDIFAGGNLAASYSYGDITFAGVGTATSVCDGEVVGFGHPFDFLGDTSLTLHPATALYVQPESLGAPFKVANLGAPVGTIFGDHLSGITGFFGGTPTGMDVSSTVTYGSRNRSGETTVSHPLAAPAATFYQLIANHDRVIDGILKGTELQSWSITGDYNGQPFAFNQDDRFTSSFDISFEASIDLADLVYFLSSVDGVTIDEVTSNGVVTSSTARYRVVGSELKVRGKWLKVSHRNPIRTKPGKLLRMRAILKSTTGATTTTPFSLRVPEDAERRGQIFMTGGSDYYGSYYDFYEGPVAFEDIEALINGLVRNDSVFASLNFGFGGPGGEEDCRGCRGGEVPTEITATSAPVDQVVSGFKRIKVIIK